MTPPLCINPTETVWGVLESHQRLLGLRSDSGVLGLVELLAESLQLDHLLQTRKIQICGFVVLTCAAGSCGGMREGSTNYDTAHRNESMELTEILGYLPILHPW